MKNFLSKQSFLFFLFFSISLTTINAIQNITAQKTENNGSQPRATKPAKAQLKRTNKQPEITTQIKNERFIVVVVPSYNNKDWCAVNLASIFSQKYTNYHVIYVDDKSPDGTADRVAQYVKEKNLEDKITLVRNTERLYAAQNRYDAICSCPDHAIVVNLDGDDWWFRDDALSTINDAYENKNVWFTYSQFLNWPTNVPGYGREFPANIIQKRAFRSYKWIIGHSQTFYAWLCKQIKKEDLMVDGKFFRSATDWAMFYPIIEMAGSKIKFIDGIYYTRNVATDLNLFKVAHASQLRNFDIIKSRPVYGEIKELPFDQSTGICKVEYITTKVTATQKIWTSKIIEPSNQKKVL